MIDNYISRKVLEKERYYQFRGEYFPSSLEESPLGLYGLIVKGSKKIILLGDAGYGKSTELKKIFSKFVEEENPNFIPIFIELNTYTDEDIETYVKLKIGEDSLDLLNYDSSKLVFLFDEFDQVIDKGKAERKIKNFIEQYNKSTFVISCRTNFYSGQFEDFNIFVLLPLDSNDIQEYAKKILGNICTSFIKELHQNSVFDLAKNPFFFQHLIEIYKADKKIPQNRADIFSRVITLSLERDETKLRDKYDLKQTYPIAEIVRDLMYLSLIIETLQRNFISVGELNQVINDKRKGQIISELSLTKKSFFKEGDVFQFQHNNFQEYLSAKSIANANFDEILNFISFVNERDLPWLEKIITLFNYIELKPFGIKVGPLISTLFKRVKYKRINKIIPSWVNTVSFLCQLRHENDLLEYLYENEPELCLKFEANRIDERKREKIFKNIFEKYTKRKIWLDRDRIDYEEMANFAPKSKEIYTYLIDFARSKEHFIYRYNAIQILESMRELADESLYNLLVQYAKDENENPNVRHISLYALAWLGWATIETIEKLKHLKDSGDEVLLSSFYYLISESAYIEGYVDLLLEGIQKTKGSTLLDVRWHLRQGIEKIKSIDGIRRIIKYFIENPGELRDYHMKESIQQIIKNAINAYNLNSPFYDDMKKLAGIVVKNHIDEIIPAIRTFFSATGTAIRFFKETYEVGIENNYSLLASIADESCVSFLIEEYQKGKVTEDNVQIFINFLAWRNKDDFNHILNMVNLKTGKFLPALPRDYGKEKKEKLQRKVQLIFDKREFVKEVEQIFIGEGKKELNCEDFENIWDAEKYNDFIIRKLMHYFERDKSKKWTFDNLRAEIGKSDYESFTVANIFNLLFDEPDLELLEEQKTIIKDFCLKNLNKVDFKNALKQEDKTTTANTLATMLWYFVRKLNLDYPKEVLLDMLSFDWIEANGYVGIEYLIERLPHEDSKKRILQNLNEGISVDQVLKNHIEYCRKYHVLDAKELLYKIIEDKNIEIENRLLALKTIVMLGDSTKFLEKILDADELKLFIEVANVLILQDNKRCKKKLINNLNSGKKDFALESAKLLIEDQNIKAIKFYANYIKRTKEFKATIRGDSLFNAINTIKALPILFDLLKFCYVYRNKIKQDEFSTLNSAVIAALKKIALRNYSNFNKVLKEIHKFIKKYDSQLEGINFLNIVCDNIEKAFFANYSTRLTIDNAKRKVNSF